MLRTVLSLPLLCGLLGCLGANAALPLVVEGAPLPSLAPILEDVQPAVVNVSTIIRTGRPETSLEELYRRQFNLPPRQYRPSQSRGSGVIIDADKGLVVTNHHVIDEADSIAITTHDGRTFEAELIGSDEATDVAVLQIDADALSAIRLGRSSELRVGDFVVAIGSPFGLSQTVTSGIVSALGRSGLGIEGYEDFIQTDASINPGNSGGALINLRGELIGISTAILSRSGGSVGIGFAIPIDMVSTLMDQLIEFGDIQRGLLGVRMQSLTPELAEAFDVRGKKGVVVSEVIAGSTAETAGIKEGDVIVKFNDTEISDNFDLRNAVGLLRTGTNSTVQFYRDGKLQTVAVKIGATEDTTGLAGGGLEKLQGAQLKTAEPGVRHGGGVLVVEIAPDSPAAETGLQAGDILLAVNRQPVRSLAELRAVAKRAAGDLLIKLLRDDFVHFEVL